jgi:FkbM family methyltransferase
MELFRVYWFKRSLRHIKNKGLLSFIKYGLIFFYNLLNYKKVGSIPFFYYFKKKRRLNRNFCKNNLLDFDDVNIERYFNYYLNTKKIPKKPITYGFGIGGQIKFEEIISDKFDSNVYCYDPTPAAKDFIINYKGSKKIKLFPYGIWSKDQKIKFYFFDGQSNKGASITNYFETNKNDYSEKLQCYTLKTLMNKNNHKFIDILKLDIEGAAFDVLENILQDKIYPTQIVTEFEFSEKDNLNSNDEIKYQKFSLKLKNLINKMKNLGYKCYNMPKFTNQPYHSIEILFIRYSN